MNNGPMPVKNAARKIVIKELPANIKILDQTGKRISVEKDKKRVALMPGKRISKTGKIYWETRRNRSDVKGKKI